MILTADQIKFLLEQLRFETVAEWDAGRFRVQHSQSGYRDGIAGKCQAALSVMLEAKMRVAGR